MSAADNWAARHAIDINLGTRKRTMLTPEQTELRLQCLHLAVNGYSEHPTETVKRAQAYHDFLTGKSNQTPREVIDAALTKAGVS